MIHKTIALLVSAAVQVANAQARNDSAAVEQPARVAAAVGAGTVRFPGGRTEQATAVALRARVLSWLSVAANPSVVRTTVPAALPGSVPQHQVGLADLPLSLEAEHEFAVTASPSVGLTGIVSLPTGDTASGLGAGETGYALEGSAGFSPSTRLRVSGGIGRSLSGVSVEGLLNGSAGSWGYAEASTPIGGNDAGNIGIGLESDLGAGDPTLGHSRSISTTIDWSLSRMGDLSLSASHGISGIAPSWAFALRFGTGWVGLGTAARNGLQAIEQTFGSGAHGGTRGKSGFGHGHGRGRGKGG